MTLAANKTKKLPTLFSTHYDAKGQPRIKIAKPVLASIVKAQANGCLLAKGCPPLKEEAEAYEAAGKALLSKIGALGGLELVAVDEG